mmetsp:Transcript_25004/g.69748  ORF Transcript_25004/g.69748 Transcript_25004/m.69748 type:complete len:573 (-) Transcript_25004:224-1942(-)|eukprot:CAMPEP_0117676518 /NCGR_PEP_ID=MMETSP0804-20121206/16214_1 /TAXON_ID=1074897 /ORGANISM="Tetraselmis astigmatica, Strain CCMP880" /LENGTH=572 /DNA_ID=CAMNT_0005485659 /DNA_START=119 /DNA_END=1837 /DNA_ORIENTATION=-
MSSYSYPFKSTTSNHRSAAPPASRAVAPTLRPISGRSRRAPAGRTSALGVRSAAPSSSSRRQTFGRFRTTARHMALQAAAGSPQEAGQQPPEASFEDGGPEDDDFKGAKLLWLLTSLACIGLLGMCVSQVEPFYPTVAKAQFHATEFAIGVVIAVMPLTVAVFSQFVGLALRRVGHFRVLLFGLVVLSLSTIAFPWAQSMEMAGGIRVLQGVGAAAVQTPVVARATVMFPRHMSTVMGLIETATGVGFMIGPVVGGLLYEIGDYWLPFLVMGALNAGLIILSICAHASDGQKSLAEAHSSQMASDDEGVAAEAALASKPSMLRSLPLAVHCLSTVFMSVSYGFLGPILATELKGTLEVGALGTGLVFALGAAIYSCMAPLSGWLADNVTGNRFLIFVGFFLCGVSLLLFGPAPIIPAGSQGLQWTYKLAGMSLLGLGLSLTVPLVPDMVQSEKGRPGAEERIAALWGTMFSMGEVLGPAVGGLLGQLLGFRAACSAAGVFMLAWAAFLWLLAVSKIMGWCCPSPVLGSTFRAGGVWQEDSAPMSPRCGAARVEAEEPLLGGSSNGNARLTGA